MTKILAIFAEEVVPRGLEPRTLRLLPVRSDQLSYETAWRLRKKNLTKKIR